MHRRHIVDRTDPNRVTVTPYAFIAEDPGHAPWLGYLKISRAHGVMFERKWNPIRVYAGAAGTHIAFTDMPVHLLIVLVVHSASRLGQEEFANLILAWLHFGLPAAQCP